MHFIVRRRAGAVMIRVAICDDDISVLNQIQGFLARYCRERGLEIAHAVFHSPVELLAEIEWGG